MVEVFDFDKGLDLGPHLLLLFTHSLSNLKETIRLNVNAK